MNLSPLKVAMDWTRPYLQGYAAVLFCNHRLAGLLVLAVTFVRPEVGAAGLVAAIAARLVAWSLGYADVEQPPEVYNALLVGLALGATWQFTLPLAGLAALAGVLTALVTHVVAAWLWRLGRLPALSLTFALVTWLFILAAPRLGMPLQAVAELYPAIGPHWLNGFFTAFGWFLFTPHPLAGLAMLVALTISSRYLALLCVSGYAVGALALELLGAAVEPSVVGFNFMLAAMAVGGLFAFPDKVSFLWGMFAALVAALLSVAMAAVFGRIGLPALAAPFLFASLIVLAGLTARRAGKRPFMLLEAPNMPERSLLAAELARARLGEPGSYPIAPPFFGEWQVSQGIDGTQTHRGAWRFAYDFILVDEQELSYRGDGRALEDYHAFGKPALAPVSGHVHRVENSVVDNAPGELDVRPRRNFGNHVMLRTSDGMFVLLAHLKRGSLAVTPGEWVEAGQVVGACGNSGRSTQPHLHVQVQAYDDLGAPTVPVHLRGVLVRPVGERVADYRLSARPAETSNVAAASIDRDLAMAVHMPPGRKLTFQSDGGQSHALQVDVMLLGQFRLTSERGASAAFDERKDVLAFYDRSGTSDACLDAYVLALGLTPLSGLARSWTDAPPSTLAPLTLWQRIAVAVLRPFGASFASRYQRVWDEKSGAWLQMGRHDLRLASAFVVSVVTEAIVDRRLGCRQITVSNGQRRDRYILHDTGIAGELGAPETRIPV